MPLTPTEPTPLPSTPELELLLESKKLTGRVVASHLGPRCAEYSDLILFQKWAEAATLVDKVVAELDALNKPAVVTPAAQPDLAGRSWGADSGVPK